MNVNGASVVAGHNLFGAGKGVSEKGDVQDKQFGAVLAASQDKVTLSRQGMEAANQGPSAIHSLTPESVWAGHMEYPPEYYAIPPWQTQFYYKLSLELNSPSHYVDPANEKFSKLSDGELRQYSNLFRSHVQGLYEQNGLANVEDSYKAMFVDKEMSEKLRQQFNESLRGDGQMMMLLNKMGLELS
jgi:hypothetical protein